ncbi:MAG: sugar ABC transporter permease, partial [Actinomycetota bacterium]|nr:sugar ABC transporter permease [Actinomycetota bacterium]
LLNPEFGLLNIMLDYVGIDGPNWLGSTTWALPSLIVVSLWGFGGTMLVFLAGLQGVPGELYEAVEVDGGSAWHKFRNVTLPLTWDVLGVAGVLWTIGAIKIFELVFVLAGPGTYSPPIRAWTLGIYVFDRSFGTQGSPEYGMACAAAVMMIALVSVLVVLLRRLMRRDTIQF